MNGYRATGRIGGNAAMTRYPGARAKSRRQVLAELYGPHNPDEWSEEYLELLFGDLVTGLGLWSYHTERSDRSDKGYPDETVLGGRETLWVELKRAEGAVTSAQRDVIHRINGSGGLVRVYRPADWRRGRVADDLGALRGRGRPPQPWPANEYRCGCEIALVHTDGHQPGCPIERTVRKTAAGQPGKPWWR